jgi:HK97 gp10 family phage protein
VSSSFNDGFIRQLEADLTRNLEAAAIYFKDRVKTAINRSQPYERVVGKRGIYYHGLDPSEPGSPPKKVRGDLQRSIVHKMKDGKAYVGSNLDYAFYLETGTVKMSARPFLRPTLYAEKDTLLRIIATGKR